MFMKNIVPNIFRQRLLVESFYSIDVTEEVLRTYLWDIAAHLELRAYDKPIIFTPAMGMGKEENQGFEAFLPLIDSGISVYVWSKSKFLSVILYTCKGFESEKAVYFTQNFFQCVGEVVYQSF